jgi:hypothetical protein
VLEQQTFVKWIYDTLAATGYEGLYFRSINDANNDFNEIARFDTKTGDISFYEDTGTTPKFFWDASAESLGIGTTKRQVLN